MQVHPQSFLWSVRITGNYRALGYREADTMNWFWIGTCDEYDRLRKRS